MTLIKGKINLVFEGQYKDKGFEAQRKYPNESLVSFLGKNYFGLPMKKRKNITCLELGCGSGANLWMLAKEGFKVYGIDNSPTSLKLCNEMLDHWGVKADVKIGDFRKIEFPDNFFDIIVDVLSTEHTDLEGHKEAYKEIWRCLKKNGKFFSYHIGAGSTSFIKSGGKYLDKRTVDNITNKKVPYANNGLTCFLYPKDAHGMIEKAGFKEIQIEKIIRTYKNLTQKTSFLIISAKKI